MAVKFLLPIKIALDHTVTLSVILVLCPREFKTLTLEMSLREALQCSSWLLVFVTPCSGDVVVVPAVKLGCVATSRALLFSLSGERGRN